MITYNTVSPGDSFKRNYILSIQKGLNFIETTISNMINQILCGITGFFYTILEISLYDFSS